MNVDAPILDRMKLFLDFSIRKQKVITSNLANVETPGYRAKSLEFEEVFRGEVQNAVSLRETRARHLQAKPRLLRKPELESHRNDALGHDGNNVDLNHEMTQLAQNVLKFSVVSQMYQSKIQQIKYSLREGRG